MKLKYHSDILKNGCDPEDILHCLIVPYIITRMINVLQIHDALPQLQGFSSISCKADCTQSCIIAVNDAWLEVFAEFLTTNSDNVIYKYHKENSCFTKKFEPNNDTSRCISIREVFELELPEVITNLASTIFKNKNN